MKKYKFSISDYHLFFIILGILCFSLVILYSATYQKISIGFAADYWNKQLTWMIIGIFAMLFVGSMDYRKLGSIVWGIYFFNILLLVLVFLIGKKIYGAQRWISIGGFSLQPSELMKLTVIITLSWYLYRREHIKWGLSKLFVSGLIVLFPMAMILKQPDLGTSLVLMPIYFSIVFISGIPIKYLITIFCAGIVSSPLAWMMLKGYQKSRIMVFLNPQNDQFGAGWTVIQSKIAIGSGKFAGKGLLKGTQTQLNFLPEHHTDFIFSVIGEELGFLGVVFIIGLYFLLVARSLHIAKQSRDSFGAYLITGVIAMISFHIMVNIGMTFGFMPATGLPLPLVSYGGSSILSIMTALGIVFSVRKRGRYNTIKN